MTLKIDGSYGEGGGQIVRTALALSVATGKPVELYNIRAKRNPPGLKHQHLGVVKLFKKISDAEVEGAYVGSTYLKFVPRKIRYINVELDLKTAASITLLIQAVSILLPVIEKPLEITVIGGTDVKHSPSIDYMKYAFTAALRKLGLNLSIDVIKRGFYPKGGGIVKLKLEPGEPELEMTFEDFEPRRAELGLIAVASLSLKSRHVAGRIFQSALTRLRAYNLVPKITRVEYAETLSPGAVVTVFAVDQKAVLGADKLGERGLPSEKLGKMVVEDFISEVRSGASVDKHLADMLVPFGFFMKKLEYRTSELTNHLLTNLWVASKFFENHEYWVSEKDKTIKIMEA